MEDIHSFFLGIDIITDIRSILLYSTVYDIYSEKQLKDIKILLTI